MTTNWEEVAKEYKKVCETAEPYIRKQSEVISALNYQIDLLKQRLRCQDKHIMLLKAKLESIPREK